MIVTGTHLRVYAVLMLMLIRAEILSAQNMANEFADTVSAPTKAGRSRLAIDQSDLLVRQGSGPMKLLNSVQYVGKVSDLQRYKGRATCIIYDGSIWLKKTGTIKPDNAMLVVADRKNSYWERQYAGAVNAQWFGAKGDGIANDLDALQAAINYVCAAANPAKFGSLSPRNGRSSTLYIPAGVYLVKEGELMVPGAIRIEGDGGLSYAGTIIYQRSSNRNLFRLSFDTDGGSNCVQLENIRLRGHGSGNPTASLVYGDSKSKIGYNSLHIKNVWFQGWEKYALNLEKGDDLQVTECVFDGATNQAFNLGLAYEKASVVTNAAFTDNTFYEIKGGIGFLAHVDGFLFSHNRVYGTAQHQIPFVLDGVAYDAVNPNAVSILNNRLNYANVLYRTKYGGFIVQGNIATNCTSRVIEIGGGGTVSNFQIRANHFQGTWTGTVKIGKAIIPDAPIFAYGTKFANAICDGIIDGKANSNTPVLLTTDNPKSNTLNFVTTGFSKTAPIIFDEK